MAAKVHAISPAPADQESSEPLKPYFVPASDANGHSSRLLCRVPPSMKNQLAAACHDPFPWKDESSVTRFCLDLGLRSVARMTTNKDFRSVQSALDAWVSQAQTQMEMLHFKKTLVVLQTGVDELMAAGHDPAARKILESVKERVDQIDDPYWRTAYQQDFIDRYGEQLGMPRELPIGVAVNHIGKPGRRVRE